MKERRMKLLYYTLLVLHLFVGVGAMAGGLAAITNPLAPLGAPVELLKNSPFTDFFIPGLLLFGVIGGGNIFSAIMFCFKSKFQGYISGMFGVGLMIWIVVQCVMLRGIVPLHVIFFIIGLFQAILSLILLVERRAHF